MKKSFIILGPGHICAQNILENLKTTKKCVFFFLYYYTYLNILFFVQFPCFPWYVVCIVHARTRCMVTPVLHEFTRGTK